MTDDILFEQHGATGLITLNRPKALNALTLPMVRAMRPVFERWARDPSVARIVIKGAGERAFCAGGDIRAIHDLGKEGRKDEALAFFREEYELNILIKTCPKPYVALLDGITMGGGIGLSVHGSHRVGSDKASFAMPEVGIGFFPDVGGSFFLPRMPYHTGAYAALTGGRLTQADALATGLLTHAVNSADMAALEAALLAGEDLEATLARFAAPPAPSALWAERETIQRCFGQESVPAIVAALQAEGTEFAAKTLAAMAQKSPFSQVLTLEELRRGATLSMPECMRMEFTMVSRIPDHADFYEGVRAVLVDKDQSPRWQPARLEDVDNAAVGAFFASPAVPELTIPTL